MALQYLTFASSDDGAERGCWEAMASVRAQQVAQVKGELQAVLDWTESHSPGPRGAEEDGGVWDSHVHALTEPDGWWTVTLTIVGPCAWGEALLTHFEAPY